MRRKAFYVMPLVCMLVLVLSLCPTLTFAAQPEMEMELKSNVEVRYIASGVVTSTRTYLYNNATTGSGYVFNGNVPEGSLVDVKSSVGSFYHADVTVTSGPNVGVYTGYILKSHVTLY